MAIQNNINAAIGTVGSAIALGQHVSEQKKSVAKMDEANELAKEAARKQDIRDKIEELEKGKQLSEDVDKTLDALGEESKIRAVDTKEIESIENSLEGSYTNVKDKKLRTSKNQFMSQKAFEAKEDAVNAKRASIEASILNTERLANHSKYLLQQQGLYKDLTGIDIARVYQGGNK